MKEINHKLEFIVNTLRAVLSKYDEIWKTKNPLQWYQIEMFKQPPKAIIDVQKCFVAMFKIVFPKFPQLTDDKLIKIALLKENDINDMYDGLKNLELETDDTMSKFTIQFRQAINQGNATNMQQIAADIENEYQGAQPHHRGPQGPRP